MADQTITIDRIQIKRSSTPGARPDALARGEEFVNFADGIRQIGDGITPAAALPEYPLRPGIDDVPGLAQSLSEVSGAVDEAKADVAGRLAADKNLSDLADPAAARTALGANKPNGLATLNAAGRLAGDASDLAVMPPDFGSQSSIGAALAERATKAQVPDLGVNPGAADSGPALSTALQALGAAAGGRPRLPARNYAVSGVTLRSGVTLEGQSKAISASFGTGTLIKARAGSGAIFTAPDSNPVHTVGVRDLTLDGSALAEGGACVRAGFLESSFDRISLLGRGDQGSGYPGTFGFDHLPTFPASWINYRTNLLVTGHGVGIRMGGSDSLDSGHYITSNNIGYLIQGTTGSIRFGESMIDLCNTGLVVESPPSTYFSNPSPNFSNVAQYGSIYHFNKQNVRLKFIQSNGFSSAQFAHAHVGNIYNFTTDSNQTAFAIESNLYGGMISGCVFAQNARPIEIEFGGTGNTGWMANFSSDKPASGRILNMPPDIHLLSGGPGGQKNYLTDLTVNDPGNTGGVVSDARTNLYGSSTVLGQGNVAVRIGVGRNNGADAAILMGVANGNGPFIKPSNGEQTQSAGLAIYGATGPGIVIDRDGNLRPYADGGRNCGTPTARWANVYAQNGTIVTSDQKIKTAPQPIPEALLAAAADIEVVWFQYQDAIAEKGEEHARKHVGVIAQQVLAALAKHGLGEAEAFRWGFIGRDPEYRREVTKRRVEHPVFETIEQPGARVVIRDGKAVRETWVEHVPVRVQDLLPLFDENGEPVMETVPVRGPDGEIEYLTDEAGELIYQRDSNGELLMRAGVPVPTPKAEVRQATHMVDRVTVEDVEEVEMVPTGGTILAVRYDQLALLMTAALRRRLSQDA